MYYCIISIRGEVWAHKTSLTPPFFIDVPDPSSVSERSCICVRDIDFSAILEVFRQCGILEVFRQCGILEVSRQCGILEVFRQYGILSTSEYGVYFSHFTRYVRAWNVYSDFHKRHRILSVKLFKSQGFWMNDLILSFKKVFGRYQQSVKKHSVTCAQMTKDSIDN